MLPGTFSNRISCKPNIVASPGFRQVLRFSNRRLALNRAAILESGSACREIG